MVVRLTRVNNFVLIVSVPYISVVVPMRVPQDAGPVDEHVHVTVGVALGGMGVLAQLILGCVQRPARPPCSEIFRSPSACTAPKWE
jgi:hypothetical protein